MSLSELDGTKEGVLALLANVNLGKLLGGFLEIVPGIAQLGRNMK